MDILKKYKDKIIIFVIIIIVVLNGYILKFKGKDDSIEYSIAEEDLVNDSEENEEEISDIMIHITGSIKNPGVFSANLGDRLQDIIEKSGGFTENADIKSVNLAMKVEDEMKIHIPSIDESVQYSNNDNIQNNKANKDTVNINNATKEELMTLPGIGDSKSDKILEYRENKTFKSIDDIKNVNGIGEKTFDSFKDLIDI